MKIQKKGGGYLIFAKCDKLPRGGGGGGDVGERPQIANLQLTEKARMDVRPDPSSGRGKVGGKTAKNTIFVGGMLSGGRL